MNIIKKLLPYIIILIVVVIIRTFIITPAVVNGDSMEETLMDGEVVLVNKLYMLLNDMHRYDIVVIEENGEKLVKRIVGMPGEKVEYKDNKLYIDGLEVISEIEFQSTEDFVYNQVEEGKYFVLGDNREVSKDSRVLGTIKEENIIGKVNLVLFPFNKIGIVK